MRLALVVFSLVAGLTACVEASIRAAPYQIMFLWNAYQIELETFGPGNTVTAKFCNHERACTFDEFIKFIELTGRRRTGFTGTTGVPANARELPTVATAENLKAIGYSSIIDPSKLYPSDYIRQDPTPTLGKLLGHSFSAIQRARRETKNPSGLTKFLDLAGESLDDCIDMRRADQSDAVNRDLTEDMKSHGYDGTKFELEYRNPKPTLPNGDTYDQIDVYKTFTNAKNRASLGAWDWFGNFLTAYVNSYENWEGAPKKHAAAIAALQEFSMKLQFPVGSC